MFHSIKLELRSGFVNDDVYCSTVDDRKSRANDFFFMLVGKLEYACEREYQTAKEKFEQRRSAAERIDGTELAQMEASLELLKERATFESARNAEALARVEPIIYGQILQVFHLNSGKFVTLVPNKGGKRDKESRRLGLSQAPPPGCESRTLMYFKVWG